MKDIYREPVKPELIAQRIEEIKSQGVVAAASLTPQKVRRYYEVALEAGLGGPDRPGNPGTGRCARARLKGRAPPAAQSQGVHPRAGPDPDHRRRLRLLP